MARGWSRRTGVRPLFLMALIAACTVESTDEERIDRQSQAVASTCRTITLEASKDFKPTRWADGSDDASPPIRFEQPASVSVLAGNSGNSHITLERAVGSVTVECVYRGETVPHPITPAQIQAGLTYWFSSCSDGAQAGDLVEAEHFRLHLQNSDQRSRTRA